MRTHYLAFAISLLGCGQAAVEEEAPIQASGDFYSDELEAQLDQATEQVRTGGFSTVDEEWRGFVVSQDNQVRETTLRTGRCHVFVAAGSQAIESMELTVYDSEGVQIARSTPGTRAVQLCPPQSGVHFVALQATGSGLFTVRRFEGPAGLELRLEDLAEPNP